MKIPIVNENDEIVCYKEREETTREDIRRIVGLYVFDENKKILIAKRHSSKKIDPNCWGPAVAGTVDEGFGYEDTVIKEAEEEIGLKNIKPIFLKKYFYETYNARRFSSVYYVIINSRKTILVKQDDEVLDLKWVDFIELQKWFSEKPEEFIPSFKNAINNIKEIYENQN
jgi:isopentenyldiphosphate isomerase